MQIDRYSVCCGCLLSVAAGAKLHVVTDEEENLEVLMCSSCDPEENEEEENND